MCYLAVSPCSTLTARLCLQTANRSSTTWTCWFKSTQSATPLSFSPHAINHFFSCSTWPTTWLPRKLQLWAHANLSHSRCKCEAKYLRITFMEEISCDIPLCQCGAETKYQQQDIGEQIRHKVNAFHLDSRPHAMLGLQSGADVKSSAALLIYEANPVFTCAYENYGSAKVQDRRKKWRNHSTWKVFVLVFKSTMVNLFHHRNGLIIMGLQSEWCFG